MKIFGKSVSDYFVFQRPIMILIVLVGLTRLGLSLAGVPESIVKWFSLTAVAFIGVAYCGVKVPRRNFGGYKHLLPLYFMQSATGNLIIAGGILLSVLTGTPNIFSVPEYSGPLASSQWLHAGGHILDGILIGPLAGWLFGSIIMFLTRKFTPA